MTDEEKNAIILQDVYAIENIDYLKELLNRAQNEIPEPKKSTEKGFEEYWVIYNTNLLSKNNRIAYTATHIESKRKVIILHDFFDILPPIVRRFILHHVAKWEIQLLI